MALDAVGLCECWGRDGIQGWPRTVTAEHKAEVLNGALAAGFEEVEVCAFVSPRITRQFDDAAQVLSMLRRPEGRRTRAIVPNERGLERALEANASSGAITTIGFPISASESHNLANLGRSREQSVREARRIADAAHAEGLDVVAAVATAFGCPLEGIVPRAAVLELVDELAACGVGRLMLADTTGLADPRSAHDLFAEAVERVPGVEWIAHFHDTRGRGIANTLAALAGGAGTADCSLGGLGGEPDAVEHGHVGESGNVVSEDLVSVLAQMEVETRVDPALVLELGRRVEAVMGRALRSQVLRSGPGLEASRAATTIEGRT